MPRYFIRASRPKADGWVADDVWSEDSGGHIPDVPEHVAVDTGLLDADGNSIMRAPNPIGFIWDD